MRIGICSSDFTPVPADVLFSKIKHHGFSVTQFSFISVTEANFVPSGQIEIPAEINDAIVEKVKAAANEHNIEIAVCNGTFNMAHPDIDVRDEGLRCFSNYAVTVRKLGCGVISLCSGTRNKDDLWAYHEDNATDEAWKDMVDTVEKAVQIAEKNNIVLALETEAANVVDTPEKARKLMDKINSPHLKMIIDCANLFHNGEAKKENVRSIVNHAFEVFGKDIIVAHGKDIKESDGIEFCGTGFGILDFKQFAELLCKHNYKGDMFLHGIYDENNMAHGINVIKNSCLC